MARAVFLDRDGTLNREVSYLSRTGDLELLPGVVEALLRLQERGFQLIIVSNQSGVARGYFTLRRMKKINRHLQRMLRKRGVRLTGIYACPWHERGRRGPYRRAHGWRKPSPGMLLEAAEKFGIILSECWMVGDRESDIAAGAAAGCGTVLVKTGYGAAAASGAGSWESAPDFIVDDLSAAVDAIFLREGCDA